MGKRNHFEIHQSTLLFFFFLIRPASKGINQSLTYWYDLGKKYLTEAHYKYPYSTLAHYKHLKWEEKKNEKHVQSSQSRDKGSLKN